MMVGCPNFRAGCQRGDYGVGEVWRRGCRRIKDLWSFAWWFSGIRECVREETEENSGPNLGGTSEGPLALTERGQAE